MITFPRPSTDERIDPLLVPATPARRPTPTPRHGARHRRPATAGKAVSLALSAVTTVGLAAALSHGDEAAGATTTAAAPGTGSTVTPASTTATAVTGSTESESATASAAATGAIVDGTYVGDASTNRWGTVQVQAVFSGGELVDVQVLQYPDADRKSVEINQRALPTLIADAIDLQTADVDTVSGATYTSVSYRDSLQSAIDSALVASGLA